MNDKFNDWFEDERAVSPVIGVILMVAITVILAAVIGTFVLDLGQSAGNNAPQASLAVSVDTNTNNVTIEHTGGDALDAGDTRVIVEDATGNTVTYDPGTAGNTLSVGGSVEAELDNSFNVSAPWSSMSGSGTAITVSSGDQITITVIDTNSQRQIFETTVTA